MKARHSVLLIGVLAAAAGCTRHDDATKIFGSSLTHDYLKKVGQVRSLINTDNRDRIPGMIRGQDYSMLRGQAAKIEGYMHTLASLGTNGVDPDALKFMQNFAAILDGYKSVCLDSAELFREVKEARSRQPTPGVSPPELKFSLESSQTDTIGALDALLESADRMDATARVGAIFLEPIVSKVRDDRDKLRSAKAVHHDFTQKIKADFAQRYPGVDWTHKEILP
jgi:hypothetical protein